MVDNYRSSASITSASAEMSTPSERPSNTLDNLTSDRKAGERVIGLHLWPIRYFMHSNTEEFSQERATECIRSSTIDGRTLFVTRMGGLFTTPLVKLNDPFRHGSPDSPADKAVKLKYQHSVAEFFNQIICELALEGVVSEPASPAFISYGQMIEGHILITVTSGGREYYPERTLSPSRTLIRGGELNLLPIGEPILDSALRLVKAMQLVKISRLLPSLIAGAYSAYSRGLYSEAVANSWVVAEQIQNHFWETYLGSFPKTDRKKRLEDHRVYTTAVKTEVLQTAGLLSPDLCEWIHAARGKRNDLMHDARLAEDAADQLMEVMRQLISLFCNEELQPAMKNEDVVW